jgi:hypothetical protein
MQHWGLLYKIVHFNFMQSLIPAWRMFRTCELGEWFSTMMFLPMIHHDHWWRLHSSFHLSVLMGTSRCHLSLAQQTIDITPIGCPSWHHKGLFYYYFMIVKIIMLVDDDVLDITHIRCGVKNAFGNSLYCTECVCQTSFISDGWGWVITASGHLYWCCNDMAVSAGARNILLHWVGGWLKHRSAVSFSKLFHYVKQFPKHAMWNIKFTL